MMLRLLLLAGAAVIVEAAALRRKLPLIVRAPVLRRLSAPIGGAVAVLDAQGRQVTGPGGGGRRRTRREPLPRRMLRGRRFSRCGAAEPSAGSEWSCAGPRPAFRDRRRTGSDPGKSDSRDNRLVRSQAASAKARPALVHELAFGIEICFHGIDSFSQASQAQPAAGLGSSPTYQRSAGHS